MVQLLLEMKSNLDAIVQQAFQKNEGFANALKEAFENFINQRQNKYASSSRLECCHHHSCPPSSSGPYS